MRRVLNKTAHESKHSKTGHSIQPLNKDILGLHLCLKQRSPLVIQTKQRLTIFCRLL